MNDVCGIVVTYHPDAGLPERLDMIAAQVNALVIVDNGSSDEDVHMLRKVAASSGLNLVLNSQNLGIAQALNAGIQKARALGYRWVLLLDQDSRVHDDLLDTLLTARESADKSQVAVIGSGYRDLHSESAETGPAVDAGCDEVEWVITSGSLLSLDAHSVIGPFREEFFIDYVDIEYCIRARARGYRIFNTRRPLMSHSVGAPTQHTLLWTKKWTTNHSADRRYYFARNDTVMLREHGNLKWGSWRVKSFARSFRTCKRILLYENSKAGKVLAVMQGWWDGIHGNMGARKRHA